MRKELKHILVPVDFNDPSLHAVQYGYNLAERLGGDLVLLNVLDTPGWLSDFFSSGDNLVKITDSAKEKLLELAKSLQGDNSKVQIITRIERGKPFAKILEVADKIYARMIILGENHQGEDMEQDLGLTVYQVTLKSHVPVLTLKGNMEKMGERIVVPLDLTKQTRKQLFSAMVYGMNYGAQIHLVSVLIGGVKIRESRIMKKLKEAKRTLEENGVDTRIKLFNRSEIQPFKRVLQYAQEINAGLILVMTHQEGYTYDNYIGAFAHHIINESEVPVLSLTSSAMNMNYDQMLKGLVDPIGMFLK